MFSQPNLSQSQQPDAHYDYDGLSGAWLWLPWWVHISIAIVAWPLSWWVLPILPFQNAVISEFLFNFKVQIASAISILTVITAFLSYFKAYQIRQRQQAQKKITKSKRTVVAKPATKKVSKPIKKTREKPITKTQQKVSKVKNDKIVKKPVVKKKRAVQNKNEQQTQLDF
ncbi:hypothetical protein [Wohlfahrtiimonas larvae]|uniref:Poly-beta-1,6-N-acetyl-D-glucosamine biosynthesis protein PgaD n=1 Tax=Wohlfahrtiimonas larvae TaxID=1157986 RepID=A0ABP9MNZ7_9GAMM|nr:hypothetical protein [Wohlfahrtiimonas larvae]